MLSMVPCCWCLSLIRLGECSGDDRWRVRLLEWSGVEREEKENDEGKGIEVKGM